MRPGFGSRQHGKSAAVEYAITILKVAHSIVLTLKFRSSARLQTYIAECQSHVRIAKILIGSSFVRDAIADVKGFAHGLGHNIGTGEIEHYRVTDETFVPV